MKPGDIVMETIESIKELYNFIQMIGFLPLFSNSVPGFSVEDHTRASAWWTGDPETDPWVWRQILAKDENTAYGKFFDKKAGFTSRTLLKGGMFIYTLTEFESRPTNVLWQTMEL